MLRIVAIRPVQRMASVKYLEKSDFGMPSIVADFELGARSNGPCEGRTRPFAAGRD